MAVSQKTGTLMENGTGKENKPCYNKFWIVNQTQLLKRPCLFVCLWQTNNVSYKCAEMDVGTLLTSYSAYIFCEPCVHNHSFRANQLFTSGTSYSPDLIILTQKQNAASSKLRQMQNVKSFTQRKFHKPNFTHANVFGTQFLLTQKQNTALSFLWQENQGWIKSCLPGKFLFDKISQTNLWTRLFWHIEKPHPAFWEETTELIFIRWTPTLWDFWRQILNLHQVSVS